MMGYDIDFFIYISVYILCVYIVVVFIWVFLLLSYVWDYMMGLRYRNLLGGYVGIEFECLVWDN